jgi:YVTN family beta-propeller protein
VSGILLHLMNLRRSFLFVCALSVASCDGSSVLGELTFQDASKLKDVDDAAHDVADALVTPDGMIDATADVVSEDQTMVADTDEVGTDVSFELSTLDIQTDGSPDGTDIGIVDVPLTGPVLPRPGRSSGIAITPDERVVITANRGANTVTVFGAGVGVAPSISRTLEINMGPETEPWQVETTPDGDSAFVLLRRSQQVAKINGLHSATPTVEMTRATVGSEPTSMALSPTGAKLYVSNWGDGTISVVNTTTLATTQTIDLNAPLAMSGFLGGTTSGRRALAHPRAVVMTNDNDGDDTDETLFITEFFGQRRTTGLPTGLDRFDQSHVGVIYRLQLATEVVSIHTLGATADILFRAGDGNVAGCFANQLYAATIAQNKLFVTGVCASPRGPVGAVAPTPPGDGGTDAAVDAATDVADVADALPPPPPLDPVGANFRTENTGVIYVMDLAGTEFTGSRVLLTKRWYDLYDARRTPDDAQRRYPLIPIDIDFAASTSGTTTASTVAYISAYGADGLFRVTFTPSGSVTSVGSATGAAFADLGAAVAPATAGSGPYGVATAGAGSAAFVVSGGNAFRCGSYCTSRAKVFCNGPWALVVQRSGVEFM